MPCGGSARRTVGAEAAFGLRASELVESKFRLGINPIYIYMYIQLCTCTYTYTCINIHIYIYIYIYIYI